MHLLLKLHGADVTDRRETLNIPFHEIDDPNGLCRDITGLGRWGNGDVEVRLESSDQLPYVPGLIRQAFDQQMGGVDV